MVELGRPGRLAGKGFYDYDEAGKRTGLWPGLAEHFPVQGNPADVDLHELEERMLVIEAVESARCVEEGVLLTTADANIGSIMGIGFPPWTGGVLQYVNGYPGGVAAFVARADEFARQVRRALRAEPAAAQEGRERRDVLDLIAPRSTCPGYVAPIACDASRDNSSRSRGGTLPGPLTGVRVIELPAIGPVPFLGMLLADLGAEVVRIDKLPGARPGLGDAFAGQPARPRPALDRARHPQARGRRGRCCACCESADALIEGFRPGVAERLGVGPDAALARNPQLVYGRMTGWGQDGPLARTAGHDITYLALTGLLHGIGRAGGPPVPAGQLRRRLRRRGDVPRHRRCSPALLHARATGEGQVVDAAMTDGAAYLGSMTRTFLGAGRLEGRARGQPARRRLAELPLLHLRRRPLRRGRRARAAVLGRAVQRARPGPGHRAVALRPGPVRRLRGDARADRSPTRTRDEWAEVFAPLDACVAPVLTLAEALDAPAQRRPRHVRRGRRRRRARARAPQFSATPGAAGPLTEVGAATRELLARPATRRAGSPHSRPLGAI